MIAAHTALPPAHTSGGSAPSTTILQNQERHWRQDGALLKPLKLKPPSPEGPELQGRSNDGPAVLQAMFKVLDTRGPADSMNLLRDILETMKLVQAITGTGAAASFVHANTYADSRGEAFGVLTGFSTVLAFLSLIVTVIIYVSLGLLEHEDMVAVEGYLLRYWRTLACLVLGSITSMLLMSAAIVVDAFRAYSKQSASILLLTSLVGLFVIINLWISSARYFFTGAAPNPVTARSSGSGSEDGEMISLMSSPPGSAREVTVDDGENATFVHQINRLRCHMGISDMV